MPTNPAEALEPSERPAPAIRVSGASGLVTSVPYLLGFEPRDSLVAVFTRRTGGRVVLCLRVDAPATGRIDTNGDDGGSESGDLDGGSADLRAEIGQAVRRALAAGARLDVAHLVVFSDRAREFPFRDAAIGIRRELQDSGIELGEWLAASGDRWWHYLCRRDDCCPAAGRFLDDSDGTRAAFDLVTAGIGFAASREELAGRLDSDPMDLLPVEAMARACAESVLHSVSRRGAVRWRRAREDELVDLATAGNPLLDAAGDPPTEQEEDLRVARWAVALQDPRVREPLLHRLLFSGPIDGRAARLQSARAILTDLVRRTPCPEVAAVASTLAAVAWQQGDGAFARFAAERALAADTGNVLAGLIRHSAGSGLPPSQWLEVLASYTPAMLRGTRPIPESLGGSRLPRAG